MSYLPKNPLNQSSAVVDNQEKLRVIIEQGSAVWSPINQNNSNQLLLELLEQIPVPLMLKNFQGEILGQNFSWREQIGDFGANEPFNEPKAPFTEPFTFSNPQKDQTTSPKIGHQPQYPRNNEPQCYQDSPYTATELKNYQVSELLEEFILPENQQGTKQISRQQHPQNIYASNKQRMWQFRKFPIYLPQSQDSPPIKPMWLIQANDITEQQQLCQELEAKNADLKQLNGVKDEFLACITHEFKSPLTAILGLSSLLQDQKLGELNSRQLHYTQLIYQSGRKLMNLVNDLLDLTKLEARQLKLTLESLNIDKICQKAYKILESNYNHQLAEKISFKLEIESDLTTIVADEKRLIQMLVHLLDNAVKFTDTKGEIGLQVKSWHNWISFAVWDKGIGIPTESQHLIFQKFQQLESSLTRQFEGTGLGLVLTQRLAGAHGGDVSFISKPGQGSRFTILLPRNPEHKARNKLILLVDSIPEHLDNLTAMLKDYDYQVVIARTGPEGLEKARKLKPDFIFLSSQLPLLSGFDVLTLLKSDPKTQSIRVIVTGNSGELARGKQYGADHFLTLPVESFAFGNILSVCNLTHTNPPPLSVIYLSSDSHNISGDDEAINHLISKIESNSGIGRILEADDLEQAEMLARFWHIDVILFEGDEDSFTTLQQLSQSELLGHLPLITLDIKTTEAANQIGNLAVFPCLVASKEQNVDQLLTVIQIASRTLT